METGTPAHPLSSPASWSFLGWDMRLTHSSQHKALTQSRWCPSPSQVLPPIHTKMGGWPGRCPSGRFPKHGDPRSGPHLAARAAVLKHDSFCCRLPLHVSVLSLPSSTAELTLSSWGHGRKEPACACPLCLPYAWDIPATWRTECEGTAGPRRNGPQGAGSPGPHKPKGSSLFHVANHCVDACSFPSLGSRRHR